MYKNGDKITCVKNPFNDLEITVGRVFTYVGSTPLENGDTVLEVLDEDGQIYRTLDYFEPSQPHSKVEMHRELATQLTKIYADKNADYGDSFAIVRKKMPSAILVRLWDKVTRLEILLSGAKRKVKDESIDDTLLDLANYCLMEYIERRVDERL